MALTWEWSKVAGTITENNYGKDVTFNFYEGNAMMIVIREYKGYEGNDMYDMHWFFHDEAHAKICLRDAKMFEPNQVKKLEIYRDNCRQWEKIVKLFTKAFPEIEIILKSKKEDADNA